MIEKRLDHDGPHADRRGCAICDRRRVRVESESVERTGPSWRPLVLWRQPSRDGNRQADREGRDDEQDQIRDEVAALVPDQAGGDDSDRDRRQDAGQRGAEDEEAALENGAD